LAAPSAAAAAAAVAAAQANGEAWAHHRAGEELATVVDALLRWRWIATRWWAETYFCALRASVERRLASLSAEQLVFLTDAGLDKVRLELDKTAELLGKAYGELRAASS